MAKDRKLGQKGGGRPHPQQHHPVPQGPPFSVDWPLSNPTKTTQLSQSHNAHNSITTIPPHCPHKSSPHFLCGQSNTSSQPHPLHTFVAFPQAQQSAHYNGVVCLINCHGLTFNLLPCPSGHLTGVRGHTGRGTCPPIITSWLWARNATPNRKQ